MSDFFTLTSEEVTIIWLSVKVGLCCIALITLPAIAVSWLLARKSFWGKSILDSIIHLPLVLPPVVPGFMLLLLLGNQGLIGKHLHAIFNINIAFTWVGAVIASAVMAFPLMVRSTRLAFTQIDHGLEIAAQTLGAHPFKVFCTISIPLAMPGILTGLILAFSRSLGEFGATITFVGNIENETRTLPLAIYSFTQVPNGDMAALRLVIISIVLSLAALTISNILEQKAKDKIKAST